MAKPPQNTFNLSIDVDSEGHSKVNIAWPTDVSAQLKITVITYMLQQLTTGAWNQALLGAVQEYGLKAGQNTEAHTILSQWSGMIGDKKGNELCVAPLEVFASRKHE